MKISRPLLLFVLPLAVVVGLAAAIPLLVPVSRFLPELQSIASEKLGQPVTIAELSLHLLPTPRMVAKDIVVGKRSDAQIGELEIVPDLLSFISGARAVRLIRAERVALKESALAIPGSLPQAPGTPVLIRRVLLKQVSLQHSTLRLPTFDIDAKLGPEGVEEAHIDSSNTALVVKMNHEGQRVAQISVEGTLFGGTVSSSTRADWVKAWQIAGKANVSGVDLVPVQRLLGKPPKLSGRLKAQAAYSARARKPEQLADALALDGPFEIHGGAYQGVDLSKAADITGKSAASDVTTFEEFRGNLQARGKRVHIANLCVRSPKFVAGGTVDIAPDQSLSGKLDVSLAKTSGVVGVPIALGGTTSEPSIRPTKGYIIGAAIGTILLPGIGTGIGASAGGAVEGHSDCK
ncbi:MAG TPA: hypothetical protein VI321_05080 [Burkholderiales bacterium]